MVGFSVADYIGMLEAACEAAKSVDKDIRVIGGISCSPSNKAAREFINQGGLPRCDVMSIHWYPEVAAGAESGEKDLAEIEAMMRAKGSNIPTAITHSGITGRRHRQATCCYSRALMRGSVIVADMPD